MQEHLFDIKTLIKVASHVKQIVEVLHVMQVLSHATQLSIPLMVV
jgi:hypothetical protein